MLNPMDHRRFGVRLKDYAPFEGVAQGETALTALFSLNTDEHFLAWVKDTFVLHLEDFELDPDDPTNQYTGLTPCIPDFTTWRVNYSDARSLFSQPIPIFFNAEDFPYPAEISAIVSARVERITQAQYLDFTAKFGINVDWLQDLGS